MMTSGPSHLLPAELAECLTAFALGLQRAAAHPDGHPVVEGVVAELETRLAGIHAGRPSLTIGVAPHQLVVDGVSTDPNQPVLRELAGRLHAHALGGVMLTRGVTAAELAHLLGLLATEAGTLPMPIGLEGPELLAQWPAIRLFPVSTTVVALPDDVEAPVTGDAAAQRAATLWLGLARAALRREVSRAIESADDPAADPAAVAAAIEAQSTDATYDQSVQGYLAQGIEVLATERGAAIGSLRRRIAALLTALHPDALVRVVSAQTDRSARRRLLELGVTGVPAAALRRLLEAVARAGGEPLSPMLVRLLDGFVAHAERPEVVLRSSADLALRETVLAVRGWPAVERVNRGHRALDAGLRRRSAVFRVVDSPAAVEAERLFAIAVATGVLNASTWRQLETVARTGDPSVLVTLLDGAPAGMVRDALWAQVATPHRVREWLARTPVPAAAVGVLVERLGVAALPVLLDALDERPALIGALVGPWLAALGESALPAIQERLLGAEPAVRAQLLPLLPDPAEVVA
jgi:hypothetical protein